MQPLRDRSRGRYVHRAGPGLVLDLADGRTFAVTCEGASTAAGLVNDLLARAASTSDRHVG